VQRWRGFRPLIAVAFILMLIGPLGTTAAAAASGSTPEPVIVGLRTSSGNPSTIAQAFAQRFNFHLGFVYQRAMQGFSASLPPAVIQALARDPRVAFVEPDYTVQEQAQIVPTGIARIEADQNPNTGIGGGIENPAVGTVNIAILDTGIGPNADLNVVGGALCTSTWWGSSSCTTGGYADNNDHGTHVAGTAAGIGISGSVAGVAPGARLWAVKVLDSSGSGSISTIVAGLDWIIQQGSIDVVNMSFGCSNCASQALNTALAQAANSGIVLVAAAGNSTQDVSNFSPANNPNVIAVSAVADYNGKPGGGANSTCANFGPDDTLASFSNFGSGVALAAPGVCITSTFPNNQLGTESGTSMASPHVTGAAALYIAVNQIARSSTRWSAVKQGLINNWSVPQNSPCGFTDTKSSEPLLMVAPCGTGGTISGKVTIQGTSTGLPGATVTATGSGSPLTATTDATGSYSMGAVPAGSYSVTAAATGYATSSGQSVTVAAGQTSTTNFSLTPTYGTVSGTVTDTGNAPLGGVMVSAGGVSNTTASNGTYTLSSVPTGTQTVTASMSGYATGSQSITVTQTGPNTANFQLAAQPGTISGKVTIQGSSTGIQGVTVTATGSGSPLTASTDGNGNYTISSVPVGGYSVSATANGYGAGSAQPVSVSVTAGGSATANFTLVPQVGTITGSVTDTSGAPLVGATVSAGGVSTSTVTGGTYTLPNVPAGPQTVTASKNGYTSAQTTVTVPVQGTVAAATLKLGATAGTLSGTVTVRGSAYAGATVTLSGNGLSRTTTTDGSGHYQFTGVPAGTYTARASAYYGWIQQTQSVTVSGGTTTLNFAM